MRYPLLSEYMEAIRKAEDSFNQLSDLRPVLNGKGDPMMAIGDSSVVFKLQDVNTMRLYAVKCFTQEQPQRAEHFQKIAERMERSSSPYLLRFRYLEREFFVDTTQSDEEYFPVLLMDWTEGITLDTYLKTHLHDCYALQLLTFRFCRMSAWLLSQPFAHGNLKPESQPAQTFRIPATPLRPTMSISTISPSPPLPSHSRPSPCNPRFTRNLLRLIACCSPRPTTRTSAARPP